MAPGGLFAELTRVARAAGAEGTPEVLSDRADGQVVRVGDLVVKAHPADTDLGALRARLRTAGGTPLRDILVPPRAIHGDLLCVVHERPITAWPYGIPVDPGDPDAAPWEQSAALLAGLHRIAFTLDQSSEGSQHIGHPDRPPHSFPAAGAPARVHRAIARLRAAHSHPAATTAVLRAYDTLPALDAAPKTLVHGDFHLGQLVRLPGGGPAEPPAGVHSAGHHTAPKGPFRARAPHTGPEPQCGGVPPHAANDGQLRNSVPARLVRTPEAGENRWRLIDIDDLGLGDPVWDLARPAGYFAAGILEPLAWQRFLDAYRLGEGPAVPPGGDEWAVLDVPARAVVVQAAALAVAKTAAAPDDIDIALIDACVRMTALPYGG
ncbi:phosphotransferase [Nocardia wallacei]|uniref:phosphotransferase n=1 Tax=Nocardia wallacei TaxID=480035 RepID=UPI002458F9AE|nr:phosphotransferase [Nocardia wallacei]